MFYGTYTRIPIHVLVRSYTGIYDEYAYCMYYTGIPINWYRSSYMLLLTMLCPPLFMRQTLRMAGAPSKPNPVGFGDATETEITVKGRQRDARK